MAAQVSDSPTVSDQIERIGLGLTHVRLLFTGGGIWLSDGIMSAVIGCITPAVAAEFHLGPASTGMLFFYIYLGVFLGNLVGGPIGDRFGRRHPVIVSQLCFCVGVFCSSYAPSYAWFRISCFIVGACVGVGQPACSTLFVELSPSFWRMLMQAAMQSMFLAGAMYCYLVVYLDDPWMRNIDWRSLMRVGVVPAVVFCVTSCFWLLQSPHFLGVSGRMKEAEEVLDTMRRDNCLPDFPLAFQVPMAVDQSEKTPGWQLGAVFGSSMLATTVIMSFSCFVANFLLLATLVAFPSVLPHLASKHSTLSPAIVLLIGVSWGLPGKAMAAALASWFPRKCIIQFFLLFSGVSMLLFCVGASQGSGFGWHAGLYGALCSVNGVFVILYVCIAEVYPIDVRVSGCGVCFMFGRVGAMLSPLAFEMMTSWTGSYIPYFVLCAALPLINLLLIELLPSETPEIVSEHLDVHKGALSYGAVEGPSGAAADLLEQGA